LRRQETEVVAGHDVGTARARVGLDRLPVRKDQERQHDEQRDGDRHDKAERGDPYGRDGDAQDLLGRVGRRREVVAREHSQRSRLAEPLVRQSLGVQGRPEQPTLRAVAERLGQIDRGDAR
jgi:hypothetical protein